MSYAGGFSLPLVGFARVPPNRWDKRSQKKERLGRDTLPYEEGDIHYEEIMEKWKEEHVEEMKKRRDDISILSDMDEENGQDEEEEEEELNLDDLINKAVAKAENRYDIAAVSSYERTALPPIPEPITILYRFLKRKFNEWKARERERRMNPVYRHYQNKLLKMEEQLKKEYIDELREINREIMIQAHRDQKHRTRQMKFLEKKKVKTTKYDLMVEQRNKEAQRTNFLYVNMQKWAGENYDRDMAAAEQAQKDYIVTMEKKKQADIGAIRDQERALLEEDRLATQEVYRIMRQSGLMAGANPPPNELFLQSEYKAAKEADTKARAKAPKKMLEPVKIAPEDMLLPQDEDKSGPADPESPSQDQSQLHEEMENNMYKTGATLFVLNKEELASKPRRAFPKTYNPFNLNLIEMPYVEHLTCLVIGERGALSLSSDFVRGACPRLQVLDMSNCRIKTRGLGRLLYGMKLGNLSSLRRLVLKGNDIEPRGVSLIQGVLSSTTFANLQTLDLRDNELGDIGLDILMKMLAAGDVGNLSEIMLHRNKISDLGFKQFMKLVPRIRDKYFPNITRISLDGNNITPKVKKQFKPYPVWISC